jgi:2-haloacid dehalogenase
MMRFRLVAFDLYGTLLDISGLAGRLSAVLGRDATVLLAAWRTAQLARTWDLNRRASYETFDRVTAWALAKVAGELGELIDDATQARLADEWLTVPAHADAAVTLERLAAAGVRTAVLSNGTHPMIARALEAARLRVDDVRSVDDVHVYKPDPRVYAQLDALAPAAETLFVSSNAFDAEGAKRTGRTVAFVDRGAAQPAVAPDVRVHALAELLAVVGAAAAG